MNTPRYLMLSLAIATALAACQKPAAPDAPQAAAKPDAAAYSLDDAKLPPYIRFQAGDLDPAKNACADFNGFVNAKWYAANPIPGDRSSWGGFDALAERSLAVQQQLAEQAAAKAGATGVDKLVGDFWATGMDEARIEAQGIAQLEPEVGASDALTDGA